MPGSRALSSTEERSLLALVRRLPSRDRALVSTQLFSGFRISEVLALTIGHVADSSGTIKNKIGVRPGLLKGGYGTTRWIPVSPELRASLSAYVAHRVRSGELDLHDPHFLSRQRNQARMLRALSRSAAEKMIRTLLRRIAEGDMETLSTHSLRKSWARRLYEVSGHDLITVKEGLGHSSVSVSQRYLACDRGRLDELILKGDWTRPRPQQRAPHLVISEGSSHPRQAAAFIETTPFLPGFGEISAA